MSIKVHKVRLAALPLSISLAVLTPAALATASGAQTPAAQTPAAATAARATPQRGTVKAVDGNSLTLATDTGQQVVISVAATARVQRLAPGSTDLKTAETAALTDVAVGDRILVTGIAGDSPATFNATRVILMKSSDIAQKHEAEQQDWQKRGAGGIVSAVDAASGAITVLAGARKLQVTTTPTTIYRRYAGGSVRFEDARPGSLSQIQAGDQLLARGARSEDGGSVAAEEVVSGSFKNLSGTIVSIDAANNTVSLKDIVAKKTVTVQLTPNSALHRLPADAAARLATRAQGAGAPAKPAGVPATSPRPDGAGGASAGRPGGMTHPGGGDLSQIVARLPAVPLSDLHTGDAVMVVAEQSSTDSANLTAITMLAGVEPILAAAPGGSAAMTLSPWSVGTGAPEGGGAQ